MQLELLLPILYFLQICIPGRPTMITHETQVNDGFYSRICNIGLTVANVFSFSTDNQNPRCKIARLISSGKIFPHGTLAYPESHLD
jgi:hypothetical protein